MRPYAKVTAPSTLSFEPGVPTRTEATSPDPEAVYLSAAATFTVYAYKVAGVKFDY